LLAFVLAAFAAPANAGPVLSSLNPPYIQAGGPDVTLTVSGSGFVQGSTVILSTTIPLVTTYINSTEITAVLPASLSTLSVYREITVRNPDGSVSSYLYFDIQPVLSGVTPNSTPAGSPTTPITVAGIGFAPGISLEFVTASSSSPIFSTVLSSTTMTAFIDASLLSTPGSAKIRVLDTNYPNTTTLPFTITSASPGKATLSSLYPASVAAGGPTIGIQVNGSGFANGCTAQWNGTALSTIVINAGQLSVQIPAALTAVPGPGSITVVNPGAAASNALTFTVTAALIAGMASVSPTSAVAGSPAFTLTVNGAWIASAAVVQWNATPLATTYVSSSQLTALVPAALIANAGTANVTIVNPGANPSSPAVFTISAASPPVLSSLSPSSATAGGAGFTLTVSGSNFTSGATVQWNGSALATTYTSGSSLTAAVPASLIASPGTANITVANPGGVTTNSLVFTINPGTPAISSLSPASVTAGGPAFSLVVNGSGFLAGSTVLWNGSGAGLSTVYVGGNQLTVSIPASFIASAGTASITVSNPNGATSNPATLTIKPAAPQILGLSPNSATAGGPAFTLTVNGSGFLLGSTVQWNGSALPTSYVTGSQLTASIPASAIAAQGTASVTVVNSGSAASSPLSFTINAPVPMISSLSPSSATAGGPQFTITVNGSGFLVGSSVQWNATTLPTSYVSGTQLTAVVAATLLSNIGSASVRVVNPAGATSNTSPFTVNPPTPVISSLSPNSAAAGGSSFTLIVNGSGYTQSSTLQWNGTNLAMSYVSGNQLTALVPASLIANAGSAVVTVSNPGGATSAGSSFTISAASTPTLTITTASPLPAGTIGIPYSQGLAATGGVTPYTGWTVMDPNDLPPGISLITAVPAQLAGTPTATGTFTFTVQVTDSAHSTANKQFSLTINGGAVSISAAGIVNSASYAGGRVSPGEVVVIFGSGFGPDALAGSQLDNRGYVSTSLANTQVLFDGVAAPMIYAVAGQVSAVVPYEIRGKSATQVQVAYQNLASNIVSMPVATTIPGIFTSDASGHGQGAIINQDGTMNSASNPAPVGSIVAVYATGEGQTNPDGVDGKPDDSPAPVPVAQPVTATIGGAPATVQYAGGAPSLVAGVMQVNVQIPQGTPAGSAVPLVINVGAQSSQANVTLAIK
jgi:uncharacterized protein (TIGR03437 family)